MIRFGVLGAARIAPAAIVRPSREVEGAELTAIAARDRARAEAFARTHRIPKVHAGYEELLADPEIDAVYIPLPNGLHARWTLKAIEAGKHVLCEKPMTSNRKEAEEVAAAAEAARRRSGLLVMEAFHYRYHPLAARIAEIARGEKTAPGRPEGTPGSTGELGPLREIAIDTCVPLPLFADIRYQYELAGGATMDIGSYAVNLARFVAGETPRILSAKATTLHRDPRIDRAMTAEIAFPSGAGGHLRISLWSRRLIAIRARIIGEGGRLTVTNFIAPHLFHLLAVAANGRIHRERLPGKATYTYQLEAFVDAIGKGGPVPTSAEDAVVNMGVIDGIYRAAGLPLRGEKDSG